MAEETKTGVAQTQEPPGPGSSPPASASDQALRRRLVAGEEAAFRELLAQHGGPLRRLARVFVSSDASADEVVQETWLAVLAGIDGFEGRSALKTWIFRILVNRAKTRREREGRSVPFSAEGADDGAEPAVDPARFDGRGMWSAPPSGSPEKLLLDKEALGFLREAVAQLPERQRAVVTLRDIDGWTAEEACSVLGLSETNQRVLLHRARSQLRGALEMALGR